MYHTFTVGGLSKLGKVNRKLVSDHVRLCCAESLQVILHALQSSLAFSIALDGGTKALMPYLDFRVRFVLKSNHYNWHLIAASIYQSQTSNNMFALSTRILDVVCTNWRDKMIGIATDGESKLTGCHVGVATQFE
jgi:hypothetical protein